MFTQGTQRLAQAAVGLQPAVPMSQNGTLDEPVIDTLKRDVYRCGAQRPRCGTSADVPRLDCQGRTQHQGCAAARAAGHCGRRGAPRGLSASCSALRPRGCCAARLRAQTLTVSRAAQALRDWDLWGPLIFTMTLVRARCVARRGRSRARCRSLRARHLTRFCLRRCCSRCSRPRRRLSLPWSSPQSQSAPSRSR